MSIDEENLAGRLEVPTASTQVPLGGVRTYPTYLENLNPISAAKLSSWVVLGGFAVLVTWIGFLRWRLPVLVGFFMVLGSCIAIVPLVMKAIYTLMLSWVEYVPSFIRRDQVCPSDWECWFHKEFDTFSSSRNPVYIGIVYATTAIGAFWLGGAFDALPPLITPFCLVIAALASFVCGVGLVAIFYFARFIWKLGNRYSVRISEHAYGVLSTGKMLTKLYALVAVVWCFYTGAAAWSLRGRWIPLFVLAIPAVIFFIGSFIACQFPLHRRMVECKRAKLLEIDNLIEGLTAQQPTNMTEERRKQLEFYIGEMKRIRNWPEWPFSGANLSGVTGASLGAIAPQIIHILLPLVIPKN